MISLVLAEIGSQDPYFSTNSTLCWPHLLFAQAAPPQPRPVQLPPRYAPGHFHPAPATKHFAQWHGHSVWKNDYNHTYILSLFCAVGPPTDTPRMSATTCMSAMPHPSSTSRRPTSSLWCLLGNHLSCVRQHKSCLDRIAINPLSATFFVKLPARENTSPAAIFYIWKTFADTKM